MLNKKFGFLVKKNDLVTLREMIEQICVNPIKHRKVGVAHYTWTYARPPTIINHTLFLPLSFS